MSFFKQFPKTTYDLKRDGNLIEIKDIFRNVDINDKLINPASAYQYYYIQDGERPDQIADKLYRNSRYYWTIFIANDRLRDGYMKWPLSYQQLQRRISEEYNPYIVLELGPKSVTKLGEYANPISSLSFGVSNSLFGGDESDYIEVGLGYKLDSERNQLWLKPSSNDTAVKFRNYLNSGREFPLVLVDDDYPFDPVEGFQEDRGDGTTLRCLSLRFNTIGNGYDVDNGLGVVNGWGAAQLAPYYYTQNESRQTIYENMVGRQSTMPEKVTLSLNHENWNAGGDYYNINGHWHWNYNTGRKVYFNTSENRWIFFQNNVNQARLPVSITEEAGWWTASVGDWEDHPEGTGSDYGSDSLLGLATYEFTAGTTAVSSGTPYTYSQFLEDENDALTAIRIVKPNYIAEFAEVYKEYVNS